MNAVRLRLPTVIAIAAASVIALCLSAHLRIGVYARCIHKPLADRRSWAGRTAYAVSVSASDIGSSSISPTPSGKSPCLSRYAPRTGTAVSATASDAISAKLTVMANGKKNAPTRPGMNPSGTNTAIVASVEAVIAGPTSTVASSAARHLSLDPCMFRYTFSSTTMLSSTTLPTEIASPPKVMKFSASPCQLISSTPAKMLSGIESPITTVGRSDVSAPTIAFGRSVRKNANTTITASISPRIASRSSVVI